MNNQPLVFERVYKAPIERVWKAITDKNEMKEWYFDLNDFKLEVGFQFEFIGCDKDSTKKFVHKCEITEVIPGKKLTYSWRYDGYPGNSFVTFELVKKDENGTLLRLTHRGLETFPMDTLDFAKNNFVEGWNKILGNDLTNYLAKTE
ncbi:MAG: SRPBCC domain-containing protein [Ignavibacteriae bacterium]|nr:SRPBCC domain-containing protein [Ignavibacteriota bacterium]